MLCHLVVVDFWGIIHALPPCGGGLLGYYSCFATLWWWTFGVLFMLCHLVKVDFWGIIHALPSCEGGLLSLAGAATSIIFVFCCDKGLLRHKFCCNENVLLQWLFVVTNIILTQQTCLCLLRQKYACHDRSMFDATNICCDKSFVMTNTCLLRQTFFVAASIFLLWHVLSWQTRISCNKLTCCDKRVCRDKTSAWQKRYLWRLPSVTDFWGITDALQPCESGLWGIILVLPACDGGLLGVFLAD